VAQKGMDQISALQVAEEPLPAWIEEILVTSESRNRAGRDNFGGTTKHKILKLDIKQVFSQLI
jgi:hypothetical protein